ncbi:MAG: carbamoyltransferase HypF, partial [Desulfobulbaceae bacterium]|nr:carbamoyltransferase HypF [Desulfobulbaceae bacterium]
MTAQPKYETIVTHRLVEEQEAGIELKISGMVQGVGFRPFVYRLARYAGFSGTVSNCAEGVSVKIASPVSSSEVESFVRTLKNNCPSLATISSIDIRPVNEHFRPDGFSVVTSRATGSIRTMIPPDTAICSDCVAELLNEKNRRFHYPFINCTNCGPRFTIIHSIPYDRPTTSMKDFVLCGECEREYHDPENRRFHAQPNACWKCGPCLSWHGADGCRIKTGDPLLSAVNALKNGSILAIRGLGGFHLAVDGTCEEAVVKLRAGKKRKNKPLAIMVGDVETARLFCALSVDEEKELCSFRSPIVLVGKTDDCSPAPSLAPGIAKLGIMLPSTPMHHLLFQLPGCPRALVMTSGNKTGTPICRANDEAVEKLEGIADFFLFHNRDIISRVDDSVVQVAGGKTQLIRRSRGYVPEAVKLAVTLPQILGTGAELKNTFCVAAGNAAYLSQHIGDLKSAETLDFYEESILHLHGLLDATPQAVACDLHPDYLSTRYAEKLGIPLHRVQHHHAHAVAVMAEHGLTEDVFAVILDGSGYGPDGSVWGGELLQAGLHSFHRLGHLEEMLLPGGDVAALEPWRMGLSALFSAYGEDVTGWQVFPDSLSSIDKNMQEMIVQMMERGLHCPRTSSCGRLFDAVSALLGMRLFCNYEGQAAMELESLASRYYC